MCYAHRNTIFTRNSKFGLILILALTLPSGRLADFRSLRIASTASADGVYNMETQWLYVGTFTTTKRAIFEHDIDIPGFREQTTRFVFSHVGGSRSVVGLRLVGYCIAKPVKVPGYDKHVSEIPFEPTWSS